MNINWHQIKYYIKHYFSAKRNGHGVHSPFAFQLCEEVFYNHHSYYAFEQLYNIRKALLKDKTPIKMQDFGAGSKVLKDEFRLVKEIAKHGISTQKQSELLYKLINYLNCKLCIELGTSIGLNALYMATVNHQIKVMSIEACEDLYIFSKELAHKNEINNITFIQSTFEKTLPDLFKTIPSLDLLYMDGNHTYEASIKYFNWALEKVNTNTVIILDDIYWSKGMTKAWQEIKNNQRVRLSIDTFYFGILFFKEEIKEKIDLKLMLYKAS